MFGRISYTWQIMGASWQVLKENLSLVWFSVLSGICCLVVLASFALPLWSSGAIAETFADDSQVSEVLYYGVLFLFYFCNYFVILFFNAAIVSCAIKRIGGGTPTMADGFRYAVQSLPQIFGWALVSATVGLVLRIIEDKSEKVGAIVAGLLGMAWTLVTFLVLPILVVEKTGPLTALRKSTRLLRETWGAQLAGNFSFGLVFFLLMLLAAVPVLIGVFVPVLLIPMIVLAVLYVMALSLIQATLKTIFQAVLYAYVETGVLPTAFNERLVRGAMTPQ